MTAQTTVDDIATDYEFHGLQPVLPVRDVSRAIAYYRDVLGFSVDFLWNEDEGFVDDGVATHGRVSRGALTTGGPIRIQFQRLPPQAPLPDMGVTLMIHVARGIERLCDEFRRRGASIVSDVAVKPWGMIEFIVRDLDGHRLRLVQPHEPKT